MLDSVLGALVGPAREGVGARIQEIHPHLLELGIEVIGAGIGWVETLMSSIEPGPRRVFGVSEAV
jgi:hypothetical protein